MLQSQTVRLILPVMLQILMAETRHLPYLLRIWQEKPEQVPELIFFVVHGSTDAPAVDVIARRVGTLVSNAAYGDITNYFTVPAASYILDITPTGVPSTIVASFEADLSGLGGGSAVVFASGFLNPAANQNRQAFGLFAALANGTVVELPSVSLARLQVIHNAADLAASTVDVYVNGDFFLEDFALRTATPFVDVPAGVELNIDIAPPNSTVNETLRNFAVTLENGNTYVVLANGVVDPAAYAPNPDDRSTAFTLFAKDNVRESGMNAGNVDFFVVHGSTDAPTVDIIARGVAKLVDAAAYGDITWYIEVPAAAYTLDITTGNDNNVIVASYLADLSGLGGSSLVVFASGFFNPAANQNGPAFGVFAALSDGKVVGLSNVTSIDKDETAGTISDYSLGQNYPNPFNPSTVISFTLPQQEFVTLKVFNVIGQEVVTLVNDNLQAGRYDFTFDASALTSGVYLYQFQAGNFVQTKKMVLTQ